MRKEKCICFLIVFFSGAIASSESEQAFIYPESKPDSILTQLISTANEGLISNRGKGNSNAAESLEVNAYWTLHNPKKVLKYYRNNANKSSRIVMQYVGKLNKQIRRHEYIITLDGAKSVLSSNCWVHIQSPYAHNIKMKIDHEGKQELQWDLLREGTAIAIIKRVPKYSKKTLKTH
jgi:hypothetical protein